MRPDPVTLDLLPDHLSVCRLPPEAPIPRSVVRAPFVSITRTDDELSVVVPEDLADPEWEREDGWRVLAVRGPLDFAIVGLLADLSTRLAEAGVSLFAVSTFETDLLLVKGERLDTAIAALEAGGHAVISTADGSI